MGAKAGATQPGECHSGDPAAPAHVPPWGRSFPTFLPFAPHPPARLKEGRPGLYKVFYSPLNLVRGAAWGSDLHLEFFNWAPHPALCRTEGRDPSPHSDLGHRVPATPVARQPSIHSPASCPGHLGPRRRAPGRPLPRARRLCPRGAVRLGPWTLTLRCPQCTSSPRGGAAGTAVGRPTPDSLVPGWARPRSASRLH